MIGPIIIVAVLLLMPVAVFMTGGALAGILGHLMTRDVEAEYADTEYVSLG